MDVCDSSLGIISITLLLLLFVLLIWDHFRAPTSMSSKGSHVLITGGSLGIGKAVAEQYAREGAHVTIVARKLGPLEEAATDIRKTTKSDKIQFFSLDVAKDYEPVKKVFEKAEESFGPVDILINSAGTSVCKKFEEISIEDFQRQMNVNYMSCVYTTRAVVPQMKGRRRGRLVYISSQAGQVGLFGYSGYSPSKFALRGFAEAVQMETKPYNIQVTVLFPPDTDTPGYHSDIVGAPAETLEISKTSGMFSPESVAQKLIKDVRVGTFYSWIGLDGFLLGVTACGMTPISSVFTALCQVLVLPIARLIALFYIGVFDGIVKKRVT